MKKENVNIPIEYADIIHLPHYVSKTRPQMAVCDRAAQFSPFAALTGYDSAIKETGRLTDSFIELDDNKKSILNEKLQVIRERIKEKQELTITYFQPDDRKKGGAYVEITGYVKKIDTYMQCIVMMNGIKIPMNCIYEIEM